MDPDGHTRNRDAPAPPPVVVPSPTVPVRMLVPNFFTLLALCAGLTSIRMGIEGRYEMALAAIVFAALSRRHRRPHRAALEGVIALRRRTRQPRRFRQFRRRAGVPDLQLGPRESEERRLDLRHDLRAGVGAASRALQRGAR